MTSSSFRNLFLKTENTGKEVGYKYISGSKIIKYIWKTIIIIGNEIYISKIKYLTVDNIVYFSVLVFKSLS